MVVGDGRPVAIPFRNGPVYQLDGGIQPLGIVELGKVEEEFGLASPRRQSVPDEAVIGHPAHRRIDSTSARHSHRLFPPGRRA